MLCHRYASNHIPSKIPRLNILNCYLLVPLPIQDHIIVIGGSFLHSDLQHLFGGDHLGPSTPRTKTTPVKGGALAGTVRAGRLALLVHPWHELREPRKSPLSFTGFASSLSLSTSTIACCAASVPAVADFEHVAIVDVLEGHVQDYLDGLSLHHGLVPGRRASISAEPPAE